MCVTALAVLNFLTAVALLTGCVFVLLSLKQHLTKGNRALPAQAQYKITAQSFAFTAEILNASFSFWNQGKHLNGARTKHCEKTESPC